MDIFSPSPAGRAMSIILAGCHADPLRLSEGLDRRNMVAVYCSLFKLHLFRCLVHLCAQVVQNRLLPTVQKFYDFLNMLSVLLLGNLPCANAPASVYVIIQARSVTFRKTPCCTSLST